MLLLVFTGLSIVHTLVTRARYSVVGEGKADGRTETRRRGFPGAIGYHREPEERALDRAGSAKDARRANDEGSGEIVEAAR